MLHRRPFKLLQGSLAAISAIHLAALAPALRWGAPDTLPAALLGFWGASFATAIRNILKNMGPPVK